MTYIKNYIVLFIIWEIYFYSEILIRLFIYLLTIADAFHFEMNSRGKFIISFLRSHYCCCFAASFSLSIRGDFDLCRAYNLNMIRSSIHIKQKFKLYFFYVINTLSNVWLQLTVQWYAFHTRAGLIFSGYKIGCPSRVCLCGWTEKIRMTKSVKNLPVIAFQTVLSFSWKFSFVKLYWQIDCIHRVRDRTIN